MPKKRHGWDKRIELLLSPWDPKDWNPEAFEKLIDKGVFDSEAENDSGENYMFEAVRSGSGDIVKFLLQKGVAPNKKSKNGEIPVHIALNNENIDILRALITSDITILWSEGGSALKQLFIAALEKGKEKSAIFLLTEIGVDPEYTDGFGNNEFHFCAMHKMLKLAKMMPLSVRFYENNAKFETPLEVALLKDEGAPYVVDLIESLDPDIQKTKPLIVYKARGYIKADKFLETISFLDSVDIRFSYDPSIAFLKGVACFFVSKWSEAEKNIAKCLKLKGLSEDWKAIAEDLLDYGIVQFKLYKEKSKAVDGAGSIIQKPLPHYSFKASRADEGYESDHDPPEPPFPLDPQGRGLDWARKLIRGQAPHNPTNAPSLEADSPWSVSSSLLCEFSRSEDLDAIGDRLVLGFDGSD